MIIIKRTMLLLMSGMMMLNLCGCFALFAGVAGGAGTAVWLSGKLAQEFHAPYDATIEAAKSALRSLDIPVVEETQNENVTQIKGAYTDGRELWIDIHRISDNSTKVEVRVGAVNPDKDASARILKSMQGFL